MLFVILVNRFDRLHARVIFGGIRLTGFGFVPVEDAADKRRNQIGTRFRTGTGLRKRKQQRQVAVNAFFLQLFRRTNAFPGGGNLDQHAGAGNTLILIQANQLAGFLNRSLSIKRQTRIHFSGNTARHVFQHFTANRHNQTVGSFFDLHGGIRREMFRLRNHGFQQRRIFRTGDGFENQ